MEFSSTIFSISETEINHVIDECFGVRNKEATNNAHQTTKVYAWIYIYIYIYKKIEVANKSKQNVEKNIYLLEMHQSTK